MGNCNVDAHVPLEPFDQEGVGDVSLKDALLVIFETVDVVDDGDASASAQITRLTNPHGILIPV